MKPRRVAHVPTQKEREDQGRYHWQTYPKYDFVLTESMRLEVRATSYAVYTLEDTLSKRIEDRLLRAVHAIEGFTTEALQAAERRRQAEVERQEKQRQAEELRRRAARYTAWYDALEQLRLDAARHRDLAHVVARLRESLRQSDPAASDYIDWAEEHLEQSDPLRNLKLPGRPPPGHEPRPVDCLEADPTAPALSQVVKQQKVQLPSSTTLCCRAIRIQ